jgi:hypothetical protein
MASYLTRLNQLCAAAAAPWGGAPVCRHAASVCMLALARPQIMRGVEEGEVMTPHMAVTVGSEPVSRGGGQEPSSA